MITKYEKFRFPFFKKKDSHIDVDPYGEEHWDDGEDNFYCATCGGLIKKGQKVWIEGKYYHPTSNCIWPIEHPLY